MATPLQVGRVTSLYSLLPYIYSIIIQNLMMDNPVHDIGLQYSVIPHTMLYT